MSYCETEQEPWVVMHTTGDGVYKGRSPAGSHVWFYHPNSSKRGHEVLMKAQTDKNDLPTSSPPWYTPFVREITNLSHGPYPFLGEFGGVIDTPNH